MIRPFTLITMLLAALSGAYLFAVKHRAQVLDDQLAAVAQNSRLDAQRIRVLQAQWALEIDPTRLASLAGKFTTLQPMKPAQLVLLTALPGDLPPAGTAFPGANPANGTPPSITSVAAAPAIAALPLPPAPPPPLPPSGLPTWRVASSAPPAVIQTAHQRHSALHLAQTRAVEILAPPRPLAPMLQNYASETLPPAGAQLVAAKTAASPDESGSALGMADNLAPPQPMPLNGSGN